LELNDDDLRLLPLEKRKAKLARLLARTNVGFALNEHFHQYAVHFRLPRIPVTLCRPHFFERQAHCLCAQAAMQVQSLPEWYLALPATDARCVSRVVSANLRSTWLYLSQFRRPNVPRGIGLRRTEPSAAIGCRELSSLHVGSRTLRPNGADAERSRRVERWAMSRPPFATGRNNGPSEILGGTSTALNFLREGDVRAQISPRIFQWRIRTAHSTMR
jgi:hypothetical protein